MTVGFFVRVLLRFVVIVLVVVALLPFLHTNFW